MIGWSNVRTGHVKQPLIPIHRAQPSNPPYQVPAVEPSTPKTIIEPSAPSTTTIIKPTDELTATTVCTSERCPPWAQVNGPTSIDPATSFATTAETTILLESIIVDLIKIWNIVSPNFSPEGICLL
ncbi:hypothetical protein KIN20_028014 [Parelaphostrongylus tenuis]|uniref:Uncharacterized protein n=1 Tax=Parelaphostrongylus tenuis TaxID=148309 RepID=A0AAD5R0J0_PARTN|nr:hypothetical protein KIN20_028014 [Parelaphostrongylus tenuis]